MIRCFLVLSILLYGSVSAQLSATATTSLVWAGTVLKTIPKGYTWREMAHGKCNDAHGVSRTHLVLVSDQGIIQSSNHGWTWKVALIHHTTINDHFSDVVWDAHAKRFMATAVNREHLTYVYFKPETYETDATPVWDQGGQFTSHDNTFFAERIAASENGKIVIVEKHQSDDYQRILYQTPAHSNTDEWTDSVGVFLNRDIEELIYCKHAGSSDGQGLFVILMDDHVTNRSPIAVSVDGRTWDYVNLTKTGPISGVPGSEWKANQIACNNQGHIVATSALGAVFKFETDTYDTGKEGSGEVSYFGANSETQLWTSLTSVGNSFVAIGENENEVRISQGGVEWYNRNLPVTATWNLVRGTEHAVYALSVNSTNTSVSVAFPILLGRLWFSEADYHVRMLNLDPTLYSEPDTNDDDNDLSTGAIVGIVIGSLLLAAILVYVLYRWMRSSSAAVGDYGGN